MVGRSRIVVAILAALVITAAASAVYLTGSSSLPACGPNQALLSVLPVSPNDTLSVTPLGQMSPPDHVFPAPHLYIYVLDPRSQIDKEALVYAPGDMVLTSIGLRHYNTLGSETNYIDYTLVFYVCNDFALYFHHVRSLRYQPFVDAVSQILKTCSFSTQRNEDACSGNVSIKVRGGEVIGTTGDLKAGVAALDVGARDLRLSTGSSAFADPTRQCPGKESNIYDRCYAVCPFDYYPPAVISQLKFSSFDGTTRTKPPLCGTVFLDVKDSAQGYWFGPAKSTLTNASPDANDIYLGPDNVNPSLGVISLGTAIPGVQPSKYVFAPSASGNVNRNFSEISPDGNVYCYETNSLRGQSHPASSATTVVLLKLLNTSTLQIEVQNGGACGNGPWALGANYAVFSR